VSRFLHGLLWWTVAILIGLGVGVLVLFILLYAQAYLGM